MKGVSDDRRHHRLCSIARPGPGAVARYAGALGAGRSGPAFDVRLVSFAEMKEAAHLALHPFGQIPTYEEGDLALYALWLDGA